MSPERFDTRVHRIGARVCVCPSHNTKILSAKRELKNGRKSFRIGISNIFSVYFEFIRNGVKIESRKTAVRESSFCEYFIKANEWCALTFHKLNKHISTGWNRKVKMLFRVWTFVLFCALWTDASGAYDSNNYGMPLYRREVQIGMCNVLLHSHFEHSKLE